MFLELSRRERVSGYLQTVQQYSLEMVQTLPHEAMVLLNNIGKLMFDELLVDISYCVRHNVALDSEWDVKIKRGESAKDTNSLVGLAVLYESVMATKLSIHDTFFPYEVTRTPVAAVLCYRRLSNLSLAEYAAQLISGNYKTPQFITNQSNATSDDFRELAERISAVPY